VASQRLAKRLEAADDNAAEVRSIDGDRADARRALDVPGRRCAGEPDLNS